jgi:putative transport protein
VAYPFGVFGIILTMLLTKTVFRIRPDMELQEFNRETARNTPPLHTANLEVTNPNLAGLRIGKMPGAPHSSVVISRLLRDGRVRVPLAETTLEIGDILLAVGPQEKLEELLLIVGKASAIDLKQIESDITSKRVIVTKKSVLGRTLKELEFPRRFGVTITRLSRMGLEFPARADLALKFGDAALLVGEPEAIAQVTRELGNSTRQLNDPQIIPLLVGIALGVLVGSLPLKIPGLPAPVRLGLAGGPLIVAILLSRLGQWRSLVWHMPVSANFMIRELGISLFLACVGLRSGGRFIETIVSGDGLTWLLWGAAITFLPLVSVAFAARFFLKTNFTALTGLLAGAMTDPPALAFANTVMNSESPAVAYATVYPVTMLLRVLSTQALLMLFMR